MDEWNTSILEMSSITLYKVWTNSIMTSIGAGQRLLAESLECKAMAARYESYDARHCRLLMCRCLRYRFS